MERTRARHDGPRALRARDGLQRKLRLGRARQRQPARHRGEAGDVCDRRRRPARRGLEARAGATPCACADPPRDCARPLPRPARRGPRVGPLVFRPSGRAKRAVVVWTAAYLSRHKPPRTLKELGRPIGVLVLVFALLVLVEPDLGTALTLLLVVGAILLVSGTRVSVLASAYGIVIGLAAIAAWTSPYRRDRLLTFMDPWKDPTGAGLQNVQALISLGSGGIFGRGLGSGIEPLGYLPEAHTDMMFAVVGEELGLVGVLLVLMAFS